jgi:hypothetical protein
MRVTTIGDVASGDGKELMRELFNGHPTENSNSMQWPLQPNPAKGAWTLRKRHLRGLVSSGSTLNLTQPLGGWMAKVQRSQWQLSSQEDSLFHVTVNDIKYRQIRGGSRHQTNRGFTAMHKMQELPSDARDTKVWHAGQTVHITGWRWKHVPRLVTNPSTFQAFLKTKME